MKYYSDDDDQNKYPDCYKLLADFEERKVYTKCGDSYYDYSIDFDEFIKFAKHIEEYDKELNKGK